MPSHTGVFLQAQVIFLSADAPMAPAPSTQLGGSTLAVHLSDDLAGRARVGERVLISGSGRFLGGAPGLMAPGAHTGHPGESSKEPRVLGQLDMAGQPAAAGPEMTNGCCTFAGSPSWQA